MELIRGIILCVITLLIIGLILRKRVYDAVDRQEIWKMDIMNRNTASQLARMKGLNLSGEAQEKFESWKDKWEYIVTKELPDIEDYLFEAEELADRYRFPSAHKILRKTDEALASIETRIEKMLKELDELLLIEKESQEKIESLAPILDKLRKNILHNRFKFGRAVTYFESEISQLKEKFNQYDEFIQSGDYLKAKELVDQLETDLDLLEEETYKVPEILKMCSSNIPNQLEDLSAGMQEMKEEGYRIEHLTFEQDIEQYEIRLQDCLKALENGKISEVSTTIEEIEERIQEMYSSLEKEAIAKNYVEINISSYQKTLTELGVSFDDTRSEVEVVRKTYYLDDRDMENFLLLEKSITQSKNQLDELAKDISSKRTAHSDIREQLESGFKKLEELQQKHDEFKNQINNLRKDELEAREKLSSMIGQVNELHRKLQRSNIPGVPNFIWDVMKTASEKNNQVLVVLDKEPLDIPEVHHSLTEAESSVQNAVEQIDLMLDQAYLTEQVIQYANRYRSTYPLLAAKLSESERLFRSYEYELSLEHAATAIEEIEPGALRQIEENQQVL